MAMRRWYGKRLHLDVMTVRADDGHGFPLSVCETSADAAGKPRPLPWLIEKLSDFDHYPPLSL